MKLQTCLFILFQLEIDFDVMYPGKSMMLYSQWPKLSAFLLQKNNDTVKKEVEEALTPGN